MRKRAGKEAWRWREKVSGLVYVYQDITTLLFPQDRCIIEQTFDRKSLGRSVHLVLVLPISLNICTS